MVMDARWKVYVQDRRFDDNQISNMYLKLKWETVGRFSFDFRPMDGDESYMVANNTLRIFWGDLHKLDGVIQRVDWDSTQWCYHIYGADIRGLLLERVNTEPATVHSYTSDVQTQAMFQGCDFPTNVWTGSGENIGRYTFNYRVGIQNTVRVLGPASIRVYEMTDRGTVTAVGLDYFEDATKNWTPREYTWGYGRFVSGNLKNEPFRIADNTQNRIYLDVEGDINNPNSSCSFGTEEVIRNNGFWLPYNTNWNDAYLSADEMVGNWANLAGSDICYPVYETLEGFSSDGVSHATSSFVRWSLGDETGMTPHRSIQYMALAQRVVVKEPGDFPVLVRYRYKVIGTSGDHGADQLKLEARFYNGFIPDSQSGYTSHTVFSTSVTLPDQTLVPDSHQSDGYPGYQTALVTFTVPASEYEWHEGYVVIELYGEYIPYQNFHTTMYNWWYCSLATIDVDFVRSYFTGIEDIDIGSIYEIGNKNFRVDPQTPISPATLQQDNHIIQYNNVDDQSDHTTSMTVRGNT